MIRVLLLLLVLLALLAVVVVDNAVGIPAAFICCVVKGEEVNKSAGESLLNT